MQPISKEHFIIDVTKQKPPINLPDTDYRGLRYTSRNAGGSCVVILGKKMFEPIVYCACYDALNDSFYGLSNALFHALTELPQRYHPPAREYCIGVG